MKIILLVLHIICAVLFGVNAVVNTNIFSMIASILWSICIGMDITQLIYDD